MTCISIIFYFSIILCVHFDAAPGTEEGRKLPLINWHLPSADDKLVSYHTCMNNALPCNFSQTSYSTSGVNFGSHSPNCQVLTLVAFIHCSWVMHDTELYNINRALYTRPDLCSLDHILFWRHNSDCQRQEAFLRGFRGTPPSSPPTLASHPPLKYVAKETQRSHFLHCE
jgi:hypothetical protein